MVTRAQAIATEQRAANATDAPIGSRLREAASQSCWRVYLARRTKPCSHCGEHITKGDKHVHYWQPNWRHCLDMHPGCWDRAYEALPPNE